MAFNVNTNIDNTGQQQDGSSVPVNPSANIFGTDANGQPLYQTMFMPQKPGSGYQSYTPTNVPRSGNVNTDFEHGFGNTPYPSTRAVDATSPVDAFKSGLTQLNDPNAYHEDPTDPAGSAIKYIAGPPTEESYKKASDNAKKIGLVADALRHIGNIINTTHYAPAQKINSTFDYLDQRERLQNRQRQAAAQQQSENDYRDFKKVIAMADQQRKEKQAEENTAYRNANIYLKQKEDKRQEELHPYQVNAGKANASAAQSRAESAGYDALIKKIKSGAIQTQTDLDTEAKRLGISLKKAQLEELRQKLNGTWKPSPTTSGRGRSGGRSSGGSSSRSSGSKGEGNWYYDRNGNVVHTKSESAAKEGASANGTYVPATYDKHGKETSHWYSRKPKPSIYQRPSQKKSTVKKNKGRGW